MRKTFFLVLTVVCSMILWHSVYNYPAGCTAIADYDPDGDPIEAVLKEPTMMGTVVLNSDGSFTYTPKTDFVGVDRFTYVAREIRTDGQPSLESNEATIAIWVLEANRPPVAVGDIYKMLKNTILTIDAEHGVLRVPPEVE